MLQAMIPVVHLSTSIERELMLRQGMLYCESAQMGHSGVIFSIAKPKKNKRETGEGEAKKGE